MKSGIMLIAAGIVCTLAIAQQQALTIQFGTSGDDSMWSVVPDGEGGIFACGVAGGKLGEEHFGGSDAWVAKLTADGTIVWLKQLGTPELDQARDVLPDGEGGVFVCGVTFGDLDGPNHGGSDAWVGRFDANGAQVWIEQVGTSSADQFNNMVGDGAGGAYVSGWTGGVLGDMSHGGTDALLVHVQSDNRVLDIVQFGTPESDGGWGLTADGAGGAFVGGWTQGDLAAPNQGEEDAFIAHFDADLDQTMTIQFGTPQNDRVYGLSADSDGGTVACGTWNEAGILDQGDAWVARFDAALSESWMHVVDSGQYDHFRDVLADGAGGAVVTGWTLGVLGKQSAGQLDVVVARFDEHDDVWIEQFGTAGFDTGSGLASDGAGGAYVAGSAAGALFDDHQGAQDAILVQYGCPADTNGDGDLSILDFVAYQGLWQAQDDSADVNGDGAFDILDFVAYQSLFQSGCP